MCCSEVLNSVIRLIFGASVWLERVALGKSGHRSPIILLILLLILDDALEVFHEFGLREEVVRLPG